MKRILIIATALVAALSIIIVCLPFLIPSSVYRAQIEKSATQALGRQVTLLGEARLSVFPSISARIDGAQVANPEGFEGAYMIEAGTLSGGVRLWPLLSGQVEIGEIALTDASLRLERLADGRANWDFAAVSDQPASEAPGTTGPTGDGFATSIDRARLINASVSYIDRATRASYVLTGFNAQARLSGLDQPFTSSGDGKLNGQAFKYEVSVSTLAQLSSQAPAQIAVKLDTDYGRAGYDGAITLGEAIALDGDFDFSSSAIGSIIVALGLDLPIQGSQLKSIDAVGTVRGTADEPALTFSRLQLVATGLDAGYTGQVTLGALPALNGALEIKADRAERLLKPGQTQFAALGALGTLDLKSQISGALASPVFSNMALRQRSPVLSSDFTGNLSLAGGQSVAGTVAASSTDLRGLLGLLGVDMPAGDTFRTFSINGTAQGSLANIALVDARLALDQIAATGSLGADLGGPRPRVTATLAMQNLDLSPLLGSDQPTNAQPAMSQDWSEDPLALDGLKAIDATLDIAAASILIDRITLSDALLKTRLDNGRLSATFRQDENKPGFRAFDGNWSGDMVLDASRSVPSLQFDAVADSVAAQKMLQSLTGFDRLIGIGDLSLDLSSSGNTIKSLVNGLNGQVEADLANGALKGINLAKLVRDGTSLAALLQSGNLTAASLAEAFSPEAETDFTALLAGLSFTNGVAEITGLKLDNPVVGVTGSGTINLGARTIDIRLVPSVDTRAARQGSTLSIDDIPIPVRIRGPWSKISYEFDTGALQAELVRRARGRVTDEVTDRIGGELGGLLGQVIGRPAQPPSTTPPSTQPDAPATGTSDPAPSPAEPSLEEQLKDQAIDSALGAIFGPKKQPEETPADQ